MANFFYRVILTFVLFLPVSGRAAGKVATVDPNAGCAEEIVGAPITYFEVGQLNAENVFDAIVDTSTLDRQFVPNVSRLLPFGPKGRKTGNYDWTEQKLAVKIEMIKRMVKAMGSPRILSMVEVESEVVASRIQAAIGYDGFIMTNSPDDRGVDVALFYKTSPNFELKFRNRTRLTGEYYDTRSSRDILGAGFLVNKKHMIWIYTNHWPSQMGPAAARFRAAQDLMSEAHLRTMEWEHVPPESGYDPDLAILGVGDFNVIDADDPHAFNEVLLAKKQPVRFYDVGAEYRKSKEVSQAEKDEMPPGTYYFIDSKKKKPNSKEKSATGSWNDLDKTFANSTLMNGKSALQLDVTKYRIVHPRFASMKHVEDDGTVVWIPQPYDFEATEVGPHTGVTDHFAVVNRVNVRN